MKIIKPQALSLLTRPFEFRREFWLGIAVIAFLPAGETPALLPETAMWPFLAEELPPDQPLDAVIPKIRPEFLAVAHAFAPQGAPAVQVRTGIQLGPLIKMLDVTGDRVLDRQRGGARLSDPVPFTRMTIDWKGAYGGHGCADNPLGKGATPIDGINGHVFPVANILNAKLGREAAAVPASYGPLDQMWPARAKLAGTYDDTWLKQDFPGFARDINWTFFNAAQADQWLPERLNGDETYAFKHLHPDQPLLKGRLPGLAPRAFVVRKGQDNSFEEVPLSLTTVWFFPHRERLVLVHHGQARLAEEDGSDIARAVIGADQPGALRPAEHFYRVMQQRADLRDAPVHALRDADLAPAAWLRPDPALATPGAEKAKLQQVLARQRQRAERENAEARARATAQGLDPDKFAPPLPAVQPEPTPDELPDVILAARAEAEAQQEKAQIEAAAKKAEMAAHLAAAGMPDEEIQKQLAAKPKGPPAFSADATREELARQVTAMRLMGQLTLELEAQIASPEIAAQWDKTEADLRNAYRLTAQHQDPADPASPERSAEIRRLVSDDSSRARALYDLHGVDLSGLDLSVIDLSGVCLDGANSTGTSFVKAKLANAVLAHARMQGCVLDGADLTGANLGKAQLAGASLRRATMQGAVLAGTDLTGASLEGAELEGADLAETIVEGTDFSNVRANAIVAIKLSLRGLHAPGILLNKARFIECDLEDADLTGASLERAAFVESNLAGVRLGGAKLRKAVFAKACSLARADLSVADLTEANLRETNLSSANLNGATIALADLSKADLRNAVLTYVRGTGSRLVAADMRNADLRLGNFSQADLARADLRGAKLTGMAAYEANMARAKLDLATRRGGIFKTRMRYLPVYQPPADAPA